LSARDERPRIAFQQASPGNVFGIVPVGRGKKWASVDQQPSVAPEASGEQLLDVGGSTGLTGRANGRECQVASLMSGLGLSIWLVQREGKQVRGDGFDTGAAFDRNRFDASRNLIRQPHVDTHRSRV
jgi:hypothetical protein